MPDAWQAQNAGVGLLSWTSIQDPSTLTLPPSTRWWEPHSLTVIRFTRIGSSGRSRLSVAERSMA